MKQESLVFRRERFDELSLGLTYLSGRGLLAANIVTMGITGIGAFGVFQAFVGEQF